MMRKLATLLLGFVLLAPSLKAQELNCTVQVVAQKVSSTDQGIFDQMQKAIYDFMNTRKWTNDVFAPEERIEVNLVIEITEALSADEFKGRMTVTYRRPVYNTSYFTTVFNHIDNDFFCRYSPAIPLDFSDNAYLQNLTQILGFYAYYIIGLDYDTFAQNGGTPYLQKALTLVNNAQSAGPLGWKSFEDNDRNRYWLINNTLDPQFKPLRDCMYKYHRSGLDVMEEKNDFGRGQITLAIEGLRKIHLRKPNAPNVLMFFTAKRDEIVNIYSNAPSNEKTRIFNVLSQIDPGNLSRYEKITKG